jgi:4-amino-4-deoxy-L-arabinose transferase-like glycosyltransferase
VRSKAVCAAVVAATFGIALCIGGRLGLVEPTESRYAEIGREMQASGDFVVPTFDGAPHVEKPPLTYWALAASYAALGVNDVAARVPGLLAGVAIVLLVAAGVRRTPRGPGEDGVARGRLALVVLATMPAFLAQAAAVMTDVWLMLSMTAAALALLESDRTGGRPGLRWTLLLHGALGVGFLAKGHLPLAFVLGSASLTALIRRDARILRPFADLRGLLLLVAIPLPWFLLAERRLPGLLDLYLGRRLVGGLASAQEFHRNPWWSVWLPLQGALPWLFAVPGALVALSRERGFVRGPALPLLVLALASPVVFTLAPSRLPNYGSPMVPFLAWIVAAGSPAAPLRDGSARALAPGERAWHVGLGAGNVLVAVALGVGGCLYASVAGDAGGLVPAARTVGPILALAFAGAALATLFLPWRTRGGPADRRVARSVVLVGLGLLATLAVTFVWRSNPWVDRDLARRLAEVRSPAEEVGVAVPRSGNWGLLPFYLREEVRFFDYPEHLRLRPPEVDAPERFRPPEALAPWFGAPSRRWLLVRKKDLERTEDSVAAMTLRTVPHWTLVENGRYAVVTNLPLP